MKNILVIEDSRTINNVIKQELSKLGFTIAQAYTLFDAREALKRETFDLIILDLHLPDGEGSELIANIQSLSQTKVVVLTSLQDKELREELFHYGILDYIIKDTNLLYSIAEIVKVIYTISSGVNGKVLMIDDSEFICKQVQHVLKPRNYIFEYALTAEEGLKKLMNNNYNLLILDMELPDIHGLKVLSLIRKNAKYNALPIMVLSGTTTPEIVRDVLKNGANDILKKPFVSEEFILKTDLWIDYFKKQNALKEKSKELEYLNNNLEDMVSEEIQKSREKDQIMFRQSRQAQMGEMIAMIAHQWRQPLNIIGTATSIINQRLRKDKLDIETANDLTKKITQNIEYLSATIDDFRDFFRPDKKKEITNFTKIVERALSLVQLSLENRGIAINIESRNEKDFFSYENELVQVVLNILKNAEDVLVDKALENAKIDIIIDGKTLKMTDNGGGISKEIMEQVFDPYFSTKLDKEGTGLGLYMSKIIVNEHCNGELSVESKDGKTAFFIDLRERND